MALPVSTPCAADLVSADAQFLKLYSRFKKLVGVVVRKLTAESERDDVEQLAWIAVMQALRAGRRPEKGHESGWISTIARNTATRERKKRNELNSVELPASALALEGESDGEALDRMRFEEGYSVHGERLISSPLTGAMQQLGQRARQILEMRYMAGLSAEEVAEALGISHGSVHVSVSRSLKILRADVKKGDRQ